MASPEPRYYLGVDVGTGSARAALVNADGTVVASASQDTKTWRDPTDHRIFEQSTTDVWKSISGAVRQVIAQSGALPKHVKGIGFDATCSLAVTNWEGEPITVTRGTQLGELGERNIVLWADHRAEKEADLINATGSSVLDYVGGAISVRITSFYTRQEDTTRLEGGDLPRTPFLLLSARDGDPEDPLAEASHGGRPLRTLPILRPARFPDVPRDGIAHALALLAHVQVHVRARERLGPRVHVADRARRLRAERVCRARDGRFDRWETGRRWADDARCGGARFGAWHARRERRHRCVRAFFFRLSPSALFILMILIDFGVVTLDGWERLLRDMRKRERSLQPYHCTSLATDWLPLLERALVISSRYCNYGRLIPAFIHSPL